MDPTPNSPRAPSDLIDAMIGASRELQEAIVRLEAAGRDKARTEDAYRYAKSVAMIKLAGVCKNADEREARIHLEPVRGLDYADSPAPMEPDGRDARGNVGDLRYARDLAAEVDKAATERIRALRTILSGHQSVANALKEEAALARTSGDWSGP
jgi:hypothetical protein